MPLCDHFCPPFSTRASWQGFHGQWPAVIVQHLNTALPERYTAAPRVHPGSQIDFDEYEVRVYDAAGDRRLVAAVEIVSPANKGRPESRRQLVAKCAALLRQGASVVLVDLVTVRDFNLYAELLEWVGERDPSLGDEPPAVYATACRWRPRGTSRWLETWDRPMAVGRPLPVLPLWLSDDLAIPLDLEASYEKTCRDLRIAV